MVILDKKRKGKRGPLDPNLEFIPQGTYECEYCNTVLNKEHGRIVEYVTTHEHTKRRCYQVKEMGKEKERGRTSKVPRLSIVIDLQDTHDLQYGMHPIEMLYKMLKYRKTREMGVTIKELALALFPDQFNFDKDGNKEPTIEAIRRVSGYLSKLRKWDRNYVVVSYADRQEHGLIYYWNQQTEQDIKKAERRIEAEIKSRKHNLEHAKDVVNLTDEQKKKEEKKLDKYIDDQVKTRKMKKKKNNGDSDNGTEAGVY